MRQRHDPHYPEKEEGQLNYGTGVEALTVEAACLETVVWGRGVLACRLDGELGGEVLRERLQEGEVTVRKTEAFKKQDDVEGLWFAEGEQELDQLNHVHEAPQKFQRCVQTRHHCEVYRHC